MQELSEFELAQRRLAERKRKRNFVYIWLALLASLGLIAILDGGKIFACLVPLGAIVGLGMLATLIEIYCESPGYVSNQKQIKQEMMWLFGSEWQEVAEGQTLALAESRIRKRGKVRWLLVVHILIFIPMNVAITLIGQMGIQHHEPSVAAIRIVSVIWLILLAHHTLNAFPPKSLLARRERKVGKALLLEMQHLQPQKLKQVEKPKRDIPYIFGDDGEIIELDEENELFDEKPKQARNELT